MPLQPGQTLNNRYRIVRLLGQGGFGAVYRAWDTNLNRPCAVKENLETSPEASRQFSREATILANLSHPNLPRVTDHFSLPSQGQYLVMDFVEGDDLASMQQRQPGPVPVGKAQGWIRQVADALTYMHSLQPPVLHRDIKPANIRITPEGRAMLVDFGLVKVYDPHLQTTMGARAVTPGFAPPEQYGQGNTDARTDVYALGATLYTLVTGNEPLESVQRMIGKQMPVAQQVNPQVPAAASRVIERAMNLEPSQRYQTMAEFSGALAMPHEGAMVVKPAGEAYVRRAAPAPAMPSVRVPSAEAARPKPKGRGLMVGGGLAVAIFLCLGASLVVGALIVGSQQSSTRETSSANLQETLAERVRTTSTAQAKATTDVKSTSIVAARSTSQAKAEMTATSGLAVATTQAQMNLAATLSANTTLVFGPSSGGITHSPSNDLIEADSASVNLADFVAQVRFYNPFSVQQADWDFGFVFRHEKPNVQYRFVVRGDKTWELMNNTGSSDGTQIAKGDLPDLNVSDNGSNVIKLVCQGRRGFFYLNDVFITELDLSDRLNSGDVFVGTGFFKGSEIQGSVTKYQDFTVWSIP